MHKHTLGHRPPLRDPRQRHRSRSRQVEVVRRAEGKVAEELEVADVVGAQLEIADGHAVGRLAAEGFEVGGLHGAGEAEF